MYIPSREYDYESKRKTKEEQKENDTKTWRKKTK